MADRTRRERLLTFLLLPAVVVAVLVLLGVTVRNSLQLAKLRERSIVEATYVLAMPEDHVPSRKPSSSRTTRFGRRWE